VELDLIALAGGRHADTPLIGLPLKCSECGSATFSISVRYIGVHKPFPL
jgi:hypothetical protein